MNRFLQVFVDKLNEKKKKNIRKIALSSIFGMLSIKIKPLICFSVLSTLRISYDSIIIFLDIWLHDIYLLHFISKNGIRVFISRVWNAINFTMTNNSWKIVLKAIYARRFYWKKNRMIRHSNKMSILIEFLYFKVANLNVDIVVFVFHCSTYYTHSHITHTYKREISIQSQ